MAFLIYVGSGLPILTMMERGAESGESSTSMASSAEATSATPLSEQWTAATAGRPQHSAPAVGAEHVYVGGLDSTLSALDPADGSVAWTFDRAGSLSDSTPAVANGTVYVGSGGGEFYALSETDGAVEWTHSTGSAIVSSPTVASGTVYVGTNDGRVLALDAASGGVQWEADVGAAVYSEPAVAAGSVYVTTRGGTVLALAADSGGLAWTYDTGVELGRSSPAVGGGRVYVAANSVYALDPADGTVDWSASYGGTTASSPVVDSGSVYVGGADGVSAFDAASGTVEWTAPTNAPVDTTPAVGDVVVAAARDGTVSALSAGSGTEANGVALGATVQGSLTGDGGEVYLWTADREVVKLQVGVDGKQQWSDPATWDGEKPQAGDAVEITGGVDVVLDESPPALAGIHVDGGSLTFARQDLDLTAGYVVLAHGGRLQIGTEQEPFEQAATITLTGSRADLGTTAVPSALEAAATPGEHCGVKTICSLGGELSIHGAVDGPTWTQLDATAAAGDSSITLAESVDWDVGDEIALTSTSLDPSDVDRRTVAAVDGTTVELDEPLDHTHYGDLQSFGPGGEYKVDERGEVLNLSRNVVIQGDEASDDENFGGNVMAMNEHHEEQLQRANDGEAWPDIWADYENDPDLLPRLSGVELRRIGQEGILGRYPFHWHRYGEADGSYIRDCAIHDSYQRGVTVHGTQNATLRDNVAFDVTGHCFFLEGKNEDGRPVEDFEAGTLMEGNVGALITTFSSEDRELLVSDAAPAAFWTNGPPKSTFRDNVAAGVYGHGFWIDLDNSSEESHKPRNGEDIGTWEGNVAHSVHSNDPSGTDGVRISQNTHHNIPTDGGAAFLHGGGVGDVHGLTAYKSVVGFWSDESRNNAIRDSVIADTRNALWFMDGGVDDSVVVAHTDNQTLSTDAEQRRGYTVPEPGTTRMGSAESITGLVSFYQGARSKNTAYVGFDTDDEVPHGVFGTMQGITNNPYFAAGNRLIDSKPYLPDLPKPGRDLEINSRVIPTADGGFVGEYDDDFDISEFDGNEYRELRWGSEHLTDLASCEQIDYIGTRAGHEFDRYVYKSTARSVSISFPPGDYEVEGTVYEDIGGKGDSLESGLTYNYQGTLSPDFDAGKEGEIRIDLGYPDDYVVFAFPMDAKPTLEHVGSPPKGDLVEVDSKADVQAEESLENGRYYWDDTENTLWLRVVTNPEMANEFGTLPFKGNFELPVKRCRDNGVKFE